jgi:hypothetical protein
MNDRSDLDRLLASWFQEGPSTMPERVVDAVSVRIRPRRRATPWRLHARDPRMNNLTRLAGGLAAVLVLVVAGAVFVGKSPPSGAGSSSSHTATTDATASASPAATPRASALPYLPDGTVSAGRYRLYPLASAPGLRIDATVPDGWIGYAAWAILGPNNTDPPGGIGIGFLSPSGVFSDPCHWDVAGDRSWPQTGVVVGPTVGDLVAALVANTAYTATAVTDTALGGFPGKRLDLQLPHDIAGCDLDSSGKPRFMVFGGLDGGLYAQGPDYRMHISIVDVAGTRLVAVLGDFAGTSDADRTPARAILDSLAITP